MTTTWPIHRSTRSHASCFLRHADTAGPGAPGGGCVCVGAGQTVQHPEGAARRPRGEGTRLLLRGQAKLRPCTHGKYFFFRPVQNRYRVFVFFETAGFPGRIRLKKKSPCVFLLGFVWTPDTQTMTSSPPRAKITKSLLREDETLKSPVLGVVKRTSLV